MCNFPPSSATEETHSGRSGASRSRNFSTTSLSLDEQVEILQEQVALVQAQYSGGMRKVKTKSLKRELVLLKRQQKNEQRKARNSGDYKACSLLHVNAPPFCDEDLVI